MRRLREFTRPTSFRHLAVPRPSAAPLDPEEATFDDLQVHRSYRVYDDAAPDTVRYFMYELSQRDPGPITAEHEHFYKALRLLRLTRVPRYLRQQPESVLAAQRDMLASLRERGVLFVTLLATAPDLPMIFAYGVQAVGRSPEEAQEAADEAYAVLHAQLDGTYQQLEYTPITVSEGEALVRYQSQWRHIAVARGRPMPIEGDEQNINSKLDGNRTDVSSHAAHQLDTFIRGMTDRPFLLTMITTPISPEQMTQAARNLSKKLSEVRSEQQGQRAVTAGVALPLGFGMSLGDTHGTSHASGATHGVGMSDAISHVVTEGTSEAFSQGETLAVSATETVGETYGQSVSETAGVSQGVSEAVSSSESVTQTDSQNVGLTVGETYGESVSQSQNETLGTSFSQSATESLSESLSRTIGQSESATVSESATLSQGNTLGENWSQSLSDSVNAGQTRTEAFNQSVAESFNQTLGMSAGQSQTDGSTEGSSSGSSFSGSLGLLGGNSTEGFTFSESESDGRSNELSTSISGGGSLTEGLSESWADTVGRTLGASESVGASASETVTAGQGVSVSEGATSSESLGSSASRGTTLGETLGQTAAVGTGTTQGAQASQSQSQSATQGTALARGVGLSESVGSSSQSSLSSSQAQSQSVSASQARGMTSGVSQTATAQSSQSVADGATSSASEQQSLSDSHIVALSHAAQRSTSLGAIPSFGISVSRQTFDEMKRVRGDFLEAQLNRYLEGIRSGAFMYQMFLVCPDRDTLAGGAGLLKSAFWGDREKQLPQPFHVIDRFDDPAEQKRLIAHAQAFTSYRKTESRIELIEPYVHSSYITPGEGAVMCHPPTAESIGLLAVHDSMPVMAMPSDRTTRDLYLGRVVNGERAKVSDTRFGVDLSELTHTLVAGATGSGKTTTTLRMVTEAISATREVVTHDTDDPLEVTARQVPAGAVCLDWADSFRDLANVVDDDRFSFYSVMKPHLGKFRFNPLAIPDTGMDPSSWANTIADLFMLSYGLGEFARSIVWEALTELQAVNRLRSFTLRPPVVDNDGVVVRPPIELPAIDPSTLPDGAISEDSAGNRVANVFTCPQLSRLIGIPHLAVLVAAKIEELSQPGAANMTGTAMRDRLQTVWRRLMYFAPGEQLADMFAADVSLDKPEALQLHDLIDPDRGLVTIIETEGLDYENRRFVLGSVLMSVWRYAQFHGDGVFDHGGAGPGTFVILEEAHELFGDQPDDDRETAATRNAIYESLFRRARKYGLRLVACVQNAARVPAAITSNTSTVIAHKQWDSADKQSIAHLMNWKDAIGQHFREVRYLGELADGWAVIRLNPKTHYLQAAPIQIVVDPVDLPPVSDRDLQRRAERQARRAPATT